MSWLQGQKRGLNRAMHLFYTFIIIIREISQLQGSRQFLLLISHDKICFCDNESLYMCRYMDLHKGHTVPSCNCVVRSGQKWTSGVQQCTYWSSLLCVLGDSKGLSFPQSLFNYVKHETSIFSTVNHHWLRVVCAVFQVVLCTCWTQKASLFTVY